MEYYEFSQESKEPEFFLAEDIAKEIFAHNHSSGVAEPSHADISITQHLKDILSLVDVRVLDHLIVGSEVVSYAERGIL